MKKYKTFFTSRSSALHLIPFIGVGIISSVTCAADTTATLSGYIQLDGYNDSSTNNSRGPRGYDLLSYRSIPLDGTADAEKNGGTKMHARSSRIAFSTSTPYDNGKIITKIEGDFLGKVDSGFQTDDDTVSNSYEFRLRQAFVKWNNWLAGQTWTNFVDLKAYPEGLTLDSVVGRPFGRQAQVRYTVPTGKGDKFSISIENPDTDHNSGAGAGAGSAGYNYTENDTTPDIIATYFNTTSYGHFRLSALYRRLSVDTEISDGAGVGQTASATGYGLAASGRINIGRQFYVKWNLLGGDGIGRYLYNNQFRSSIYHYDEDTNNLSLTPEYAWGGNVSFQYKPSNKFRMNLSYGANSIDVDNALTADNVTEDINVLNFNAIWTVAPDLTWGAGITQASRTVKDGTEGDITRVMFNVKKKFSAKL